MFHAVKFGGSLNRTAPPPWPLVIAVCTEYLHFFQLLFALFAKEQLRVHFDYLYCRIAALGIIVPNLSPSALSKIDAERWSQHVVVS